MELENFTVTSDLGLDDLLTTGETDSYESVDSSLPNELDSWDFDGEDAGVAAAIFAALAGVIVFIAIFGIAFYVYNALALSKLFKKANHPNTWAGWVPVYNVWVMAEVAGYPGWMGLIAVFANCVPVIGAIGGLVVTIMIYDKLAKAYGKDSGFTVGLVLLYPIFIGILAFGQAEYVGTYSSDNGAAPAKVEEPKEEKEKEEKPKEEEEKF